MIPQWLADEVSEYRINLSEPPKTILDIGANIGAFSVWALKQWPEAKITAFEPVAENVTEFQDNVPGVPIWCAALRTFEGEAQMKVGDQHTTGSFHDIGRQTDNNISVKCLDAAKIEAADLVKIDTEGCELEILSRMDLAGSAAVLCEYHSASDALTIKELLTEQGFELIAEMDYSETTGLLKYARPGAVIFPPKPNLFIAIPTYGGTPIEFTQSLMKLQQSPPCNYSISFVPGDSLVSRARNTLTAGFLKTDCTHLLFIDSDLIFSSEQIKRLVDHDLDFVAGFYPKKKEGPVEWVCNAYVNAPLPSGLQAVRYMGTGFMLVKRCVFERMLKAYGAQLAYFSDSSKHLEFDFWSVGNYTSPESTVRSPQSEDGDRSQTDATCEQLAEAMSAGLMEEQARAAVRTRYLSEDWYFCQRWLDLGGKIYGDTRVILKHIGTATYPLQSQLGELRKG